MTSASLKRISLRWWADCCRVWKWTTNRIPNQTVRIYLTLTLSLAAVDSVWCGHLSADCTVCGLFHIPADVKKPSGGGGGSAAAVKIDPKYADPSSWINVSARSNGSVVSFNSSIDKRFPPSAVIETSSVSSHSHHDSKSGAGGCWLTTGMYPQEVLIQLPKLAHVFRFHVSMKHVKKVTVLRCENPSVPIGFDTVFESECGEAVGDAPQEETQSKEQPVLCRYLKLRIDSGYEDFAVVYSFTAEGYFIDQ